MKHFFHQRKIDDGGLLIEVLSAFNEADVTEQLKIIYDATDIIHDKRLPNTDNELSTCFKNIQELFAETGNDPLKYRALFSLWHYAESLGEQLDESPTSWIIYHLTLGNLCNRLSQYFYDQHDFKNSEIWGDRAIETIWHGINLAKQENNSGILVDHSSEDNTYGNCENNSDISNGISRDTGINEFHDENEENHEVSKTRAEITVYLCLLKLNLSVYYTDYSRRNQRSNYTSAEIELREIIEEIENSEKSGILSHLSPDIKRQYSLIYLEAKYDQIAIMRRKFNIPDARKAAEQFIKDAEEQHDLDSYDRGRYEILARLGLARIYRDMRDPDQVSDFQQERKSASNPDHCDHDDHYDHYQEAINLAVEADSISKSKTTNIDAVIVFSSVLRKKFKYSPNHKKVNKEILEAAQRDPFTKEHKGLFERLKGLAQDGHNYAKAELVKWYCMSLHSDFDREAKQLLLPEKKSIESYVDKEENIQFQFLKGILLLNSNRYTQARDVFLKIIADNDEANYIRLGTIGLKARYLLANAYMSLGQFSRAKSILQEIYDTLKEVRTYRGEPESDAKSDIRTIIDLIYCHIRQGNYEKAYQMYCNYYKDISGKKTPIEIDKSFLGSVKESRRIAGINNLISCCIFSADIKKPTQVKERLQTAVMAFRYLQKTYKKNFLNNPETNLLMGYFVLLTGQEPVKEETSTTFSVVDKTVNAVEASNEDNAGIASNSPEADASYVENLIAKIDWSNLGSRKDDLDRVKLAHKYFKIACGYKHGFSPVYNLTVDGKEPDKAYFSNHALYVSAYLISLIELESKVASSSYTHIPSSQQQASQYIGQQDAQREGNEREDGKERGNLRKQIEEFVLGLPKKYEISMNAAIALAEWLIKNRDEHLLRSFYFATIYEERGARTFNQLRSSKAFQLLTSEQRGEVVARLLCLYKHIKRLKEECTYYATAASTEKNTTSENDVSRAKTPNLAGADSTATKEAKETADKCDDEAKQHLVHYTTLETLKILLKDGARFRLNNCGYMNDVFEGREFLQCLEKVAPNDKGTDFFELYFPHLERSEKDMQPIGSHVYIGSLSVKNDSFHLWKIYAEDETGCNIEFDEDFFDINGTAYTQSKLREYLPFRYTDEDYPLYVVQYIGTKFPNHCPAPSSSSDSSNVNSNNNNGIRSDADTTASSATVNDHSTLLIDDGKPFDEITGIKYPQAGKTESIHYDDLYKLLKNIFDSWFEFEDYLKDNFQSKDTVTQELRQFVADRLNEVRFLFKSSDYEFEGEVRVVHTTEEAEVDDKFPVPRVYINLDREIKGLTVRLGSKIDDAKVDQLVTWLKHSKRVEKVELAQRNRYASAPLMGRKRRGTGETGVRDD